METGLKFDDVIYTKAFIHIKNCSYYQIRSFAILIFAVLQYSIIIAGLPFFIRLPSINCLKDSRLQVCSEADICNLKTKYIFEYTEFRSVIHEW